MCSPLSSFIPGIQSPCTCIQAIRISGINEDMGDHIVLPSTDAAQYVPVLAFVSRGKDMTVRCSEINFVGIVRVRFQRNDRAARWSNLPPLLRWSSDTYRQAQS